MSARRTILLLSVIALAAGCRYGAKTAEPVEQPRDQIRVPHEKHVKADVKCIACHEGVFDEEQVRTAAEALPSEDKCLECHREQKDKKNCGFCHTDVEHAAKKSLGEALVRMNHAKHIEATKEDCRTCHKELPEPFKGEQTAVKMKDCFGCHEHDHGKQYAQNTCTNCHPTLAKLTLKPVSDFTHEGNFVKRHATEARSSADTCAQCHDQTFCADCHAKTVSTRIELRFPENVLANYIHRGDYVGRHMIDAAADPASCARCHGTSFCSSCHTANNLTPTAVNPRDPHPTGWSFPGSANFHGPAARRDISSCASCHDKGAQSNCVTCHKVGGIGGNPHPGSWLSRHDDGEISKNGMCRACHI